MQVSVNCYKVQSRRRSGRGFHPCTQDIAITGRDIPNSPTNVVDGGFTVQSLLGVSGSIRARHFGESTLVEDNSARSPAYTTIDLQVAHRPSEHWSIGV